MLIAAEADKVIDLLYASWIPVVSREKPAVLLQVLPTREPGVVGSR
jgi:hypothetical protein